MLPRAQLDGAALNGEWLFPDDATVIESHPFVVGPGVDLPDSEIVNVGNFDVFVHGPYIEFEFSAGVYFNPATFNGWRFTDLDSRLPDIGRATLDYVSPAIAGLDPSTVSSTENSFSINLSGVTVSDAGYIRLRVDFGIFFDGFEDGTTDAWSGVSP